MVNNKSSGIHACMKCHLTSISIETIVEMVIFYFQCTLYPKNITFVRFWCKKISLCWVYHTIHSSSLFITCVRFRNKKISSAILLHLRKYYTSKIYKSSYLYTKRLLPGGIIHFRKSDTF